MWSRRVTASLRRGGAHHGARCSSTSAKVSGCSTSQRCSSSTVRSTRPWWAPSRTTSASRLPASGARGSSRNRGISASLTKSAMWSSRTLPSPIEATSATSSTTRRTWAGSASHCPTRSEIVRGRDPLADHRLLQEVLADEVLEAAPELVLAPRDQRGVRHGQAERVLEQRGHREPVGDRTDHRRLGAGVHEAPEAVLVERGQVDHGGEGQERDREGPHPAQPAAPLRVGPGVGRDHRDRPDGGGGHRPILAHARAVGRIGRMPQCRPCVR